MNKQAPNVAWYGIHGPNALDHCGVDLSDPRTLDRAAVTSEIIDRLDRKHVMLVSGPPKTGKTSLASLVSRALVQKHSQTGRMVAVYSVSAADIRENETFDESFQRQCGVDWCSAARPSVNDHDHSLSYIVVDDVQAIYIGAGSRYQSDRKVNSFWHMIKVKFLYAARVLMFATFSAGAVFTEFVSLDVRVEMGLLAINLTAAEVAEYVAKWFDGATSLGEWMESFCAQLMALTGGHVGLCAAAIDTLNELYAERGALAPLDMIGLINGRVNGAKETTLMDALNATGHVSGLQTMSQDELDRLERYIYGTDRGCTDAMDTRDQCLRSGVLAQETESHRVLSSPLMWRCFTKLRVAGIVRPLEFPTDVGSLEELMTRIVAAIDYDRLRHGRTWVGMDRWYDPAAPQKVWALELYKAMYHCTPSSVVTSVDVGASVGFMDAGRGNLWGFQVLTDGTNVAEHVARFGPDGETAWLGVDDYCLVDFRRVESMDALPLESIAVDMGHWDKLLVLCYDKRLERAVIVNSAMKTEVVWTIAEPVMQPAAPVPPPKAAEEEDDGRLLTSL